MAEEFRRIQVKKFPKVARRTETSEQKFWKTFEFPTVVKEYTAINYVDFSPVTPYNCLVTCSGKVQVFAPYTNEVKKTYTRNKENIYGARYRADGKLMVAGGESGQVQILDVSTRTILRNLKGHTKATRVSTFGKDNLTIFSASDDKTMRCWDIPMQKETLVIKAHQDYIRCGCINETNTNQFITGSYDHMVKVWDCRSSSVAMEMNHGAPIECVLMHHNGSVCLTSGKNYIKVWDMLAGGSLFHQFSNHQKTITTIRFDDRCQRLFSGSLDRNVKVYDVQDYSMVANIDYPSPILAMDISKDNNHLTVGMSDGAISLRHRPRHCVNSEKKQQTRRAQPGTYLYRIRNQSSKPDKDDLVIEETKRHKDSPADRCLRKYKYHDALDIALGKDTELSYQMSVILELSRRDALQIALSKREAKSIALIFKFLERNVANPSYGKILIPVAELLIDMYTELIGQDKVFDKSLRRLRNRISGEVRKQQDMLKLLGAVEQIFSMSNQPPAIDVLSMNSSWENGHIDCEEKIITEDCKSEEKYDLLKSNGVDMVDSEVDFVVNT